MRERYGHIQAPRMGDLRCPAAQLDLRCSRIVDPYAYLRDRNPRFSDCLHDRLLRRKASGEMPGRSGVSICIFQLLASEDAISECRAALERPLDAVDLDQIDAHPFARTWFRDHSTVTVFARLRG